MFVRFACIQAQMSLRFIATVAVLVVLCARWLGLLMTCCCAVRVFYPLLFFLQVNKVAGNFHFAAGHSYQQGSMHIHDMAPFSDKTLDFSHTIKSLAFGKTYPVRAQLLYWNPCATSELPAPSSCGSVLLGVASTKASGVDPAMVYLPMLWQGLSTLLSCAVLCCRA